MVHPLHSEPVDYIVARTESLMTLCLLLTLYCSVRDWRIAAIAACAAGMACKETMVVAPLLIVWYDVTFARGRPEGSTSVLRGARRHVVAARGPGRGVPARVFWRGLTPGRAARSAACGGYLLNQAVLVTRYLRLLIWPRGLVLGLRLPAHADARTGLAGCAGSGGAARRDRTCDPALAGAAGFAGAWLFLVLAPTSSVVPIVTEVGAERRMYAAAIPLVALTAAALWTAIAKALHGEPRRRVTFAILGFSSGGDRARRRHRFTAIASTDRH